MIRSLSALIVASVLVIVLPLRAQQSESYGDLLSPQVRSGQLSTPEHLRHYVVDGKLHLSLRDAVVLTLENNSLVRVQETQVESSKFSLLAAHQPFDPVITSSYNLTDTISPPFSALPVRTA